MQNLGISFSSMGMMGGGGGGGAMIPVERIPSLCSGTLAVWRNGCYSYGGKAVILWAVTEYQSKMLLLSASSDCSV